MRFRRSDRRERRRSVAVDVDVQPVDPVTFQEAVAEARRRRRRVDRERDRDARPRARNSRSDNASGNGRARPGRATRSTVTPSDVAQKRVRKPRHAPVDDRATVLRRAQRRQRRARAVRRVAIAAIPVFVIAVAYLVPRLGVFAIRHVEIVGASAVPDPMVRAAIDPYIDGRTIWTIDPKVISASVHRLPFVQSVTVQRHLPDTISVIVHEYEPLAFGLAGANGWLVARDGRILVKGRYEDWKDRIPLIRLRNVDARAGDTVSSEPALAILKLVPPTFPGTIRAIDGTPSGYIAYLADGPEVRFGDPGKAVLKLRVAQRLISMFPPQRRGSINYIDVSVPERPALSGTP